MKKIDGIKKTLLSAFVLLNMVGYNHSVTVHAEELSETKTEIITDAPGEDVNEIGTETDSSFLAPAGASLDAPNEIVTEAETIQQEQNMIKADADNAEVSSESGSTENAALSVLDAQTAPKYKSVDYIATIFKSGNTILNYS